MNLVMNNGCGQLGAIQTRGTCWFYSILNGFILSEDGQKILFNRLTNFYKKLKPAEKAYFDDEFNAPCPMKNLSKTKEIYFWKFIDQYLCFMSGPRAASLKAGKSASLLGGMSLQGTVAKNMGGKGAFPQAEIGKILDHVGFKGEYYIKYANDPPKFHAARKPQFVMVMQDKYYPKSYMNEIPSGLMADPKYEIMCASLVIANTNANNSETHKWHAVAGYVCNGKGYIYDSNQRKVFKCNWWNIADFKKVANEVAEAYPFFKGGQINVHTYAFAIFARKEFTKDIGTACLMKYKTNTPQAYGLNFTDPNLGRQLNSNLYNFFKPAQRAALKRKWARTEHKAPVYINKATFNSIVSGAKSRNNGYQQVNNLESAGYKLRYENFDNFSNKLRAKFPVKKAAPPPSPSPKTKRANQVRGQFALMWKGMNANNRQVVRNYIASYKSPSPSPNTKAIAKFFEPAKKTMTLENAKREINKLKTAKERANWYYQTNIKLPNGNDVKLWKYIKEKNEAESKAKKIFGTPSPSPNMKKYTLANAKRNVNALKTAKARKEYKRTRAVNMSQNNWMELGRYVDRKNYEAMQIRRAKRAAKAA